ncbi:DNA polymerase III subunit gamma/tau [Candidatus Pelagibacter sp.]|nr:DNA polymerase III subunit gamma/tau [Candidatus Pelagibacter sp.]
MKKKSEILALKYRPQTFDEFVGHEEITTAIFNSIKKDKPSNAYLFTGIRGIGKTTFARIVAKALNCENGIENLCTKDFCSNCKSIINSNHIDILEIDAASKTGVDDVRDLIEFSRYSPTIAKFKVFIIDEVHMLSKQAFNALLKTLEEPPPYLKFIFATTEVKKIPITVISRCQRYDLSRIKSDDLFEYLKKISSRENKNIEDNALKLIVKISEGSVRDSLSLLDRALISNDENLLTLDDVQNIFGYVDKSSYLDLLELIIRGDELNVLKHYRHLYNSGIESKNFLNEFLEILYYIKNIPYIKSNGKNFFLNDIDYKKIVTISSNLNVSDIFLFWEITLKVIKEIDLVSNPNLSVEMFLAQLIYIKKRKVISSPDTISNKVENTNFKIEEKKYPELVSQIKNVKQEEDKNEDNDINKISNIAELIQICLEKKEMRLKYELENNVNLVSFLNNKIEISFNEKLNNNFVKDLSEKLFDWTGNRWIISFSNEKGEITKKEQKRILIDEKIKKIKKSKNYLDLMKLIPDIELVDVKNKND